MMPEKWKRSVLLLIFLVSDTSGAFVGINIGTDVTNLPSSSTIVSILQSQNISHVRLLDADHQMLTALSNTGIEVMVSVPNDQLLGIGQSRASAADWINKNVAAFFPATNITYVAVGDEVLTKIPNAALVLVPAIQFLESALLAANLNFQVKVSSPQSTDIIPIPFPPSTAAFNSTWDPVMVQFLQFLKNTGSSFMLNAQPYYGYIKGQGIFPIEYALFRSLNPDKQIADPNTLFYYTNMFDALVDATYYSMQALNFSGIPIVVTETGWPWHGGAQEPDATVDNALAYNGNLIRHVLNGSGPPSEPATPTNTYIYELFNEDLVSGPDSDKNWGVFFVNTTSVYSLDFAGTNDSSQDSTGSVGVFCVAKPGADPSALKKGLDWACGPGSANCTDIQPGQPCYVDGDLEALASYAYNYYYHRTMASGGTCDFSNTATTTTNDPSHGSCVFAGSTRSGSGAGSNSSTGGSSFGPDSTLGPTGFINGGPSLQTVVLTHVVTVIFLSCYNL